MVNPDRNLYEPPYDDALLYDTETEPERPRSRSLVVMLGFVVVAAFAGVVWVAYNQGVIQGQRDRNPPVLEGDAGPYRQEQGERAVAQNDPSALGGEKTYDELWAEDGAAPAAPSMDPSAGVDREAPTTQELVEDSVEGGQGGPPVAVPLDPRMDPTVQLTDPAASGVEVEGPVVRDATPPAAVAAVPARLPAAPPAVAAPAAPKPLVRTQPAAVVPAPAPQIAPEAPAAVAEAAPPTASSGIGIQLGAFPSAKQAADQWSRIKGRHEALLGPYTPRFQPVQVEGKGELFRLRVIGFPDKSAAKAACDEIIAGGGACMPVGK